MEKHDIERLIAAIERLTPAPLVQADLHTHPAYLWDGESAQAVEAFTPADYDLLSAIDSQKETLLENTHRHAAGLPAHDALLWGARGTGKSASVGAVVGRLQRQGQDIALMQCRADRLGSLPLLFSLLRRTGRPFILFIDDLGFDEAGSDARVLRSLLDGGASARPHNVRIYVTSNRRHIVPRHLSEQDDPINQRDVVDDKLALSDRFGLSLGFHALDQGAYVAIVAGYAKRFDLPLDPLDAIQWAMQRGSRSGRVAWQYVVELAGRVGRTLG